MAEREASLKIKTEALKKSDKNGNNIVPEVDEPRQSVSQTISRQPYPPPHGPPTKTQFDLNQTLLVNEAVGSSLNDNNDPNIMAPTTLELSSMNHTILGLNSLDLTRSQELTNMDPTLLKTNMYTSATNSQEPNRSKEPAGSTLSHETKLLKELLKGLEKNTENLSRKMDESHLKCLDIKKILENK